jgi:hypothetical protein
MRPWTTPLAAAALGALTAAAFAQMPAPPRDPNMPDPKTVPPEMMRPEEPGTTGSTQGTLSERLNKSEGVIKPPPMPRGNEMVIKPPASPDTMPVIPPPGTSPSDPVQPK